MFIPDTVNFVQQLCAVAFVTMVDKAGMQGFKVCFYCMRFLLQRVCAELRFLHQIRVPFDGKQVHQRLFFIARLRPQKLRKFSLRQKDDAAELFVGKFNQILD